MDLPAILKAENHTDHMEYFKDHLSLSVPYLVILFLATVTGSIGNILLLITVCYVKALRTVGNLFICNLAVADLCITTFTNIFNIVGVLKGEEWFRRRPAVCEMIGIVCVTSCLTSLYSITAVSVNRYVHICHHLKYNKIFTRRNTILMCISMWIVGFSVDIPNLIGLGDHAFDKKAEVCLYDRSYHNNILFMSAVAMGIPLIITSYCYTKIFLFVRRTSRRVNQATGGGSVGGGKIGTDSTKLARTLFIIFIIFVVCWSPYVLTIVLDRYDTFPKEVHMFTILFAHVNSSVNCVLYGVSNKQFRLGYARILGIQRCYPSLLVGNSGSEQKENVLVSKSVVTKNITA